MEQPIRRRKRKKKTPNSKQLLIAGCVIGAVALIVAACIFFGAMLASCGAEPADTPRGSIKELTVEEAVRDQETMVVYTSYLDVSFPYAFSDLIGVEAINQDTATALTFTAAIGGKKHQLYTIWFNASAGTPAGSFDLKDGYEPVTVSVVFYEPDGALQGDDRTTFFATQETVNDVLSSMEKDIHFKAN